MNELEQARNIARDMFKQRNILWNKCLELQAENEEIKRQRANTINEIQSYIEIRINHVNKQLFILGRIAREVQTAVRDDDIWQLKERLGRLSAAIQVAVEEGILDWLPSKGECGGPR